MCILQKKISLFNEIYNKLEPCLQYKYDNTFAVAFTYNSTAIEGNTCTYKDVSHISNDNILPQNKTVNELCEILCNDKAFKNTIKYALIKEEINQNLICNLHKDILYFNQGAGIYRNQNVFVRGSTKDVVPVERIYQEMLFFEQDIKNKNFSSPIKKAAFIHCQFVYIHPFVDGNGRTSRLLLNLSLLKDKYPMLLIDINNKQEYFNAIRDYCDTFNTDSFEKFIEKNLNQQLDLFIKEYGAYLKDKIKVF